MKTKLHFAFLALILFFLAAVPGYSQNAGKLILENICDNRPVLKETLVQAGMAPVLTGAGPYTFFAPSDEALNQMKSADPGKLKDLLMNHLIAGRYLKDDFKDGSKMMTMGGKEVTVFRKGGNVLINGVKITQPDAVAKNGVMHMVSTWLTTP